ncbi:hypothetical protein [Vitreoscilla filiformis]|uniref:hypothetical protein n=1 Tax=Vitreoscilla filiformis TaxID=63 RepID=UPI001E30B743|nr:hypothetical protein [Vitreoscilla filiformis]
MTTVSEMVGGRVSNSLASSVRKSNCSSRTSFRLTMITMANPANSKAPQAVRSKRPMNGSRAQNVFRTCMAFT